MAQRSRAARSRPRPGLGGDVGVRLFAVCDYAVVAPDGKLYISGANIDKMFFRELPGAVGQAYLAVLLAVPWHLTGEHTITIRLLDGDRKAIGPNPLVQARADVGRPPGSKPGEEFGLPFVLPLAGIAIPREVGGYFHLEVDEKLVAIHPFQFRQAPAGAFPPTAPGPPA